jgi:hypothetical protein
MSKILTAKNNIANARIVRAVDGVGLNLLYIFGLQRRIAPT